MAVYFIHCEATAAFKVGYSLNPEERLRQLQTASPHKLQIVGTIEGGAIEEKQVHDILDEFRMEGEWFRSTPASRAIVGLLVRDGRCSCGRTEGASEAEWVSLWEVETFCYFSRKVREFLVITKRSRDGHASMPDVLAAYREAIGEDKPVEVRSIKLVNSTAPVLIHRSKVSSDKPVIVQGISLSVCEVNLITDQIISDQVGIDMLYEANQEVDKLRHKVRVLQEEVDQLRSEESPVLAIEGQVNGVTAH